MTDYARVVTNSTEMEELTDLARMKGVGTDGQTRSLIEDCIVNFEDDQVSCKVLDPMASVWAHIRGSFDDIRRNGSLLIGDIDSFRSYLNRFGDKTIVSVEEENGVFYLEFDDEHRKQGRYTATDEAHINSAQDVDALPYSFNQEEYECPGAYEQGAMLNTTFTCNVSDITDVIDDGDTTDVRKYPITVDDGHVQIRVGDDEGWIETEFQADEGKGEASSVYGYGMDNVWSNLTGTVEVYLSDGGPMWVHQGESEGDTNYSLDYMIAEDEDQ